MYILLYNVASRPICIGATITIGITFLRVTSNCFFITHCLYAHFSNEDPVWCETAKRNAGNYSLS